MYQKRILSITDGRVLKTSACSRRAQDECLLKTGACSRRAPAQDAWYSAMFITELKCDIELPVKIVILISRPHDGLF